MGRVMSGDAGHQATVVTGAGHRPRRALSTAMLALLHDGAACRCHGPIAAQHRADYFLAEGSCCSRCVRRCSRDERSVLFSIVMGMVNAGWSFAEASYELFDRANFGGRHLQRVAMRSRRRAEVELARTWAKAEDIVERNPLPTHPYERVAVLVALSDVVECDPHLFSKGQAGVTERALMRALIAKGLVRSSTLVPCSELEMVTLIQCAQKTARAAFKRLAEAGLFLELYQQHTKTTSKVWRLKLPSTDRLTSLDVAKATDERSSEVKLATTIGRLFGPNGLGRSEAETLARVPLREHRLPGGVLVGVRGGESSGSLRSCFSRDVSPGGMPRLIRGPGISASEIAGVLGKHPRTIRRHLNRLAQAGLVKKVDDLYYRLACTAEHVSDDLGIPHTDLLREEQVRRHRQGWHETLVNWGDLLRVHTAAGVRYVEPATGHIVGMSDLVEKMESKGQSA